MYVQYSAHTIDISVHVSHTGTIQMNIPPGNLADGYKKATGESSQSRHDRREANGFLWKGENKPYQHGSPDLVQGQIDHHHLQVVQYVIPLHVYQLKIE